MSSKRIALQLDAMNLLEACYALDMARDYITKKYQYTWRENERITMCVEVQDGNMDTNAD